MSADPLEPTLPSAPWDAPRTPSEPETHCPACNESFGAEHAVCPNDGTPLTASPRPAHADELIGRVFHDRYEIRAALGHGGMGTVYRARQRSVDREVAIKVIHPKLASIRPVAKRFLREARLASQLSHPSIVAVYDSGRTDDGILYLVMEILHGHPLSRELEAQRPLPLARVTAMALQICDALGAAHARGTIHRDLKPHNIVVVDDPPGSDRVKLLDFGLAKSLVDEKTSLITQTDALLGTPLYMPPEQILGKPIDERSDLYALGCILYQMLTGRPPFVGATIEAVLRGHIRDEAPPLPEGTPPAIARRIRQMLEKSPAARPASARAVRDAIAAATGAAARDDDATPAAPHVVTGGATTSKVRPAADSSRTWPIAWIFAAIAVLAAAIAWWAHRR